MFSNTILSNTNIVYFGSGNRLFKAVALLLSIFVLSTPIHAVEIDWANAGQPNATIFNSGTTVNAINNNCVPGVASCDASATVTFEVVNDGQGGEIACGYNGGAVCGAYFDTEFGGINEPQLRFAMDATGADPDDNLNICVEFDRVVEGLSFDVLDVDDGPFDDVIEVVYTSAPSATPMLQRNDLLNAFAFGDVTTGTDPNHVVPHDPSFAAPNNEVLGWGAIQPAGGNAGITDDGGNVTLDFGSTQVWGFCVRYIPGPDSPVDPGFQFIGLSGLTWTASLPVNLDYFSSTQTGNTVSVNWSTSTESFNIGFNLWGEVDGEWLALNRNLIPSQKVDSHSVLNYRRHVRLNRHNRGISKIGISSIDTQGKEEFYGPFDIGQRYGEQSVPEPIDWAGVVAQKEATMMAKGFVKKNGRWVRKAKLGGVISSEQRRLDLVFDQAGMVRLTHQDLLDAGLDLRGKRRYEIAVSYQGQAVARRVRLGGKQKVFNEQSFIDFYVDKIEGDLALYNTNAVYQISTDTNLVANMRTIRVDDDAVHQASVLKESIFEQDRYYLNASTTGSPWLDQTIGLGAGPTLDLPLTIAQDYVVGTDVELTFKLMGGFDFPEVENDHHLTISVNGQELLNELWGGIEAQTFRVTVPAALIDEQHNSIRLSAINNSANIALLLFDNYQVSYQAEAKIDGSQQQFRLTESDASAVQLDISSGSKVWAYAQDDAGNIARLAAKRRTQKQADGSRQKVLKLPKLSNSDTRYWVVGGSDFLKPVAASLVAIASTHEAQADLYIVADAAFIGPELERYAQFKRASGISTEVVSYQSLIEQFGFGMNNPLAIRDFLAQRKAGVGNASVLLVGGHTFDYLDRTGQGSVSFIPTVYRASSVIQYSPTDSPIADLDHDGLVDVSMGRWPVRTLEQLAIIIEKSTAWANGENLADGSSVLLIADSDDLNNGTSFSQQLEGLASRYGAEAPSYPNFWSQVSRVYAGDYVGSANPVASQQEAIGAQITQGNSLTIYSGHGSPTSWSFRRLLDVNAINRLESTEHTTMVIPLACYTTYYETISNESLANKLLFKERGGAVLIAGAATLGDYASNGKMINRLMRYQARERTSMGQALKMAKRSMGAANLEQTNLWTILGDPTLRFNQNYQNTESDSGSSSAVNSEINPLGRDVND